jgi:hypothetical protein
MAEVDRYGQIHAPKIGYLLMSRFNRHVKPSGGQK